MRRTAALVATVGLVSIGVAAPTLAAEGPPRHGHALVLGVVYDAEENPVGFRKCLHLAAGRPLPLSAHHAHAHTGQAGEALYEAGHAVVPLAPLSPFQDCDAIAAYVYGD